MSEDQQGGKPAQSALFPTYARFPLALVKGEGSRLWDDQGNEYLDFMSGLAVTNLGHAPANVKAALIEQLGKLWHVSNLFEIPNQERLAELLVANSSADAVFFCNSGAEANEAAIKLARRYNKKILQKDRYEIITFHQSFHGRTLATLTATGQDKVKDGYTPLPEGFVYAPYNEVSGLEAVISERTCAIMLEMVQGEGGIRPAAPDFVQEIVRLCEAHDLLLIVDEIQTGMGRTGKLFAHQHYGVEPDIFTLAKGLGSGFPIGAMLGKDKLRAAFTPGSHASTFGGTPIAAAAGIATVETMLAEQLPERAERLGKLAAEVFARELAGNPFIRQIRGLGLLIGIECAEPVADIIAELQRRGLLAVSAGPNVLRLLPSLTIPEEDFKRGLALVCAVLAEKAAALPKP